MCNEAWLLGTIQEIDQHQELLHCVLGHSICITWKHTDTRWRRIVTRKPDTIHKNYGDELNCHLKTTHTIRMDPYDQGPRLSEHTPFFYICWTVIFCPSLRTGELGETGVFHAWLGILICQVSQVLSCQPFIRFKYNEIQFLAEWLDLQRNAHVLICEQNTLPQCVTCRHEQQRLQRSTHYIAMKWCTMSEKFTIRV